MGSVWSIAVVIGPILLLAAAIYVWTRNRSAGGRTVEQSERGARKLREELDAKQDRKVDL